MTEKKSEEFINGISKSWAMTWNNYNDTDIKLLESYGKDCNYLIWGEEVGAEGTAHLQITIVFTKAKRFNAVKKLFPKCHIEKTRDLTASIMYCKKDGKFTEIDNRKQGLRSDLNLVADIIRDQGLKQALVEYPEMYLRYHNGMEKLDKMLNNKKRDFKPFVVWIYGPTGTGKTRFVHEMENDLWCCGGSLRWWQGYCQQKATLFDDFRQDYCRFDELLKILDRYPYAIEQKGGDRELYSKNMYITSPYHPQYVYKTNEDKNQLLRRIDFIVHMGTDGQINVHKGLKHYRSVIFTSVTERNRSWLKVILTLANFMSNRE